MPIKLFYQSLTNSCRIYSFLAARFQMFYSSCQTDIIKIAGKLGQTKYPKLEAVVGCHFERESIVASDQTREANLDR